jgi:RNA polymerase sigma-70 factor (family 1)
MLKFHQRDTESYRLLFEMLYPGMCLFSKKYVYDYDDAEDIVQEVFIELWNQWAKFESIEHIKAFLYLSIKNRCLNFKKHIMIKEKYFNSVMTDDEDVFEGHVIEAEVAQNISNAIRNLPEQQRQIILLSMQGLTNNDIAEDMQISINTVKLQKKIAYKKLRGKLKPLLFTLLLMY